ncbi:MAG TPA: adenylate/guanylate cyclase domain-containing protein [Burkholderiaceae bacterium]|nr:adenylate/guanylate cyclase domain-containing protein [Burkholderiaceae bacterium]
MKLQDAFRGPTSRAAARRSAALWSALFGLAAAIALSPVVERVDLWLFDREVELLRAVREPGPATGEVVIVGVDDATLAAVGGPLPLSLIHAELGRTLEAIAAAHPRTIGMDIALPAESVESLRPGYDQQLMRGLIAARESGGIVMVHHVEAGGQPARIHVPYLAAAGSDALGLALFPTDVDNVTRRFDPAIGAPAQETFLGRIAARLGVADRLAAGWIDFTRGAPFDYVPMHAVTRWAQERNDAALQAAFAGKVVLIGSVLPYVDLQPIPVNLAGWLAADKGPPPGVVLQAQAVRTLLDRGFIRGAPGWTTWVLTLLLVALAWVPGVFLRWPLLAAALGATFAGAAWSHGQGLYVPMAMSWIAGLAAVGARTSADVLLVRKDRQRLARTFGGYVSPQLLRAILAGRIDTSSGRRRMAFLFADLRGFTGWSERTEPEIVLHVLNAYYAAITPIIHRHGGTIDNFRGDGVMVLFGAPEPHAAPCDGAFAAAREILEAVRLLNSGGPGSHGMTLEVGIGLAWGDAVFGDLGSEERKDFTALGDAVNVAARLQDLAKTLGFPVLMTMALVEELSPSVRMQHAPEPLGDAPLKGHSPVAIAGWRPATIAAVTPVVAPPPAAAHAAEYSRAETPRTT